MLLLACPTQELHVRSWSGLTLAVNGEHTCWSAACLLRTRVARGSLTSVSLLVVPPMLAMTATLMRSSACLKQLIVRLETVKMSCGRRANSTVRITEAATDRGVTVRL